MGPKELLKLKMTEALELRKKALENPADFTTEDADRADTLVEEISDLQKQIQRTDDIAAKIGGLPSLKEGSESSDDNDGGVQDLKQVSGSEPEAAKSLGEQFVESEAFKSLKAAHPRGISKGESPDINVRMRTAEKAVLRRPTTGNARAVRTNEVDDLVYRPPRTLLDVITRGSTDLAWFQYRQIIAKSNNSKVVPEAAATSTTLTTLAEGFKPLSDLTTTTAEAKEYTYADGMEITNQELTDDGIMRTLIDSTLRENLDIRLEDKLLNGAGGADEPTGILITAGVLQQAYATDVPTTVRKSITKLRVTSNAPIRGVLMNPADDEAWDLMKDSHGDYISGGPYQRGPGTAWGVERIVSPAVAVGQAIIGDFSTIHLLTYSPLEILAFNQHKDYAQRNLTYIRAELRALQLIRNAARLCVIDLTP